MLASADRARFAALVRRREAREPLAYVTGVREFRGLEFAVGPSVLIPRPDSETLVEAALKRAPPGPRRVLDLGTGSGCLLLALLAEWPAAFGVGVDRSPDALSVAAANARSLGIAGRSAFVASDWSSALAGAFDVVVCNPPYVRTADIARLAPEIAWEPRRALDGGPDGLGALRAVLGGAARLLAVDGVALFEVGDGQAPVVAATIRAASLGRIVEHSDLSGSIRCLSVGLRESPQPT